MARGLRRDRYRTYSERIGRPRPWNCAASSRSWRTPRNTTPPALVAARQARLARTAGHRLHRRHGHLPRLYAGRPLRLAAEDPADQFLRLRLRLLHQPRRPANVPRARFTRRGGRRADAPFLQAQLHRGPVPLLRHHPLPRLHDGADHRGRPPAARGARLPRLHPPEDHPRCGAGIAGRAPASMPTGCRSTSSCRRREPEGAGAGEGRRPASAAPWPACGCGSTRRRRRSAPSAAPPPRASPRPGRARR